MCKQHALRIAWTIARSIAFLDFRVLRWKFTYDWKCVNTTYRVPLFMPTACFSEGPSPPFMFCSFWRRGQRLEAVSPNWLFYLSFEFELISEAMTVCMLGCVFCHCWFFFNIFFPNILFSITMTVSVSNSFDPSPDLTFCRAWSGHKLPSGKRH